MIPVLNRYHEYVLRAFLEVQIPNTLKEKAPSLIVTDSVIGSCCEQLIKKDKFLKIPSKSIMTTEDRECLMRLIDTADEYERTELMDYYRLVMLTASVLKEYAESYTLSASERIRLRQGETYCIPKRLLTRRNALHSHASHFRGRWQNRKVLTEGEKTPD